MRSRRMFIGIPLTAELKKCLKREMLRYATWPLLPVAQENLHVTLLFLGFRDEAEIPCISTQIAAACSRTTPFEICFSEITLSPKKEQPNILMLTGETSKELSSLRQRLEQSLGYILSPRKRFCPHVTLARIKRRAWRQQKKEHLIISQKVNFVEPIDQLILFESVLENDKRQYQPLVTFSLGDK